MQKLNMTKVRAVPCEVYSRVVGYFRPVRQWNAGKRQEFAERLTINLGKLANLKEGAGAEEDEE